MEKAEGKRRRWKEKWRRLKGEGERGKRNDEGLREKEKTEEEWRRLKGKCGRGKGNGEG